MSERWISDLREFEYYSVLSVEQTATQAEIKSAYRLLSRRLHPDAEPDPERKARAEETAKRLNVAFEVLGDPATRSRYDRELLERRGGDSPGVSAERHEPPPGRPAAARGAPTIRVLRQQAPVARIESVEGLCWILLALVCLVGPLLVMAHLVSDAEDPGATFNVVGPLCLVWLFGGSFFCALMSDRRPLSRRRRRVSAGTG
jgi:curved DNA-binding protein CbpA